MLARNALIEPSLARMAKRCNLSVRYTGKVIAKPLFNVHVEPRSENLQPLDLAIRSRDRAASTVSECLSRPYGLVSIDSAFS